MKSLFENSYSKYQTCQVSYIFKKSLSCEKILSCIIRDANENYAKLYTLSIRVVEIKCLPTCFIDKPVGGKYCHT